MKKNAGFTYGQLEQLKELEQMSIDTTSSQTIAKPNVRRSISWSEKEISMLMNYEQSDDSETLDERLDSARYMLHYESGHDFPSRSLSSVKKKFYEECKKR